MNVGCVFLSGWKVMPSRLVFDLILVEVQTALSGDSAAENAGISDEPS